MNGRCSIILGAITIIVTNYITTIDIFVYLISVKLFQVFAEIS